MYTEGKVNRVSTGGLLGFVLMSRSSVRAASSHALVVVAGTPVSLLLWNQAHRI